MTTMDRFRVDGKVALVTGAGSGLGRQFALTLSEAGAAVALAARRREKLAETAALIEDIGGQSMTVDLDVTDARSVTSCVRNVTSELGAPDILVNNAGIARQAFITDTSEEDWDAVMDTNLKGVFMVAQAVAKEMIRAEKGGSIINIASILGIGVSKALASYIAAKAGVIKPDQGDGPGVDPRQHTRQRHRARLFRDRNQPGGLRPGEHTNWSSRPYRWVASARWPRSRDRSCCSHRMRAAT